MWRRATTAMAMLVVVLGAASCSSLGFPKRGFVTRYFAGSSLQASVTTTNDFAGRPLKPAIDSYAGAAALPVKPDASGRVNMSTNLAQTVRTCQQAAHDRASDVAMQGYDDETQKSVFDVVYADCMNWRASH